MAEVSSVAVLKRKREGDESNAARPLKSDDDGSPTTVESLLDSDWLFAHGRGGYLTFDDLRSLSAVSKCVRRGIKKYVRTLPADVQDLLCTWCGKSPTALIFYRLRAYSFDGESIWNPNPVLRFSVGSLTYDLEYEELIGQPWKNIAGESQPQWLGSFPNVCTANDDGSKLFLCGGTQCMGENGSGWVSKDKIIKKGDTRAAALFDTNTGEWEKLPDMPSEGWRSRLCRIGSRIYVIGGGRRDGSIIRTILCFDLDQSAWVDSGCDDFPGEAQITSSAIAALNDATILVAGGDCPGDLCGTTSRQVFSLDVTTGVWSRLNDLPRYIVDDVKVCRGIRMGGLWVQQKGFIVKSRTGSESNFVFQHGDTLLQLLPSGEWEVAPDLRGLGLATIYSHQMETEMKVFTGKSWIDLSTEGFEMETNALVSNLYLGELKIGLDHVGFSIQSDRGQYFC